MKTYTILDHGQRLQAVAHEHVEGRTLDHARAQSLLKDNGRHPTPQGVVSVAILLDATDNAVFALDHYERFNADLLSRTNKVTLKDLFDWTAKEFVI